MDTISSFLFSNVDQIDCEEATRVFVTMHEYELTPGMGPRQSSQDGSNRWIKMRVKYLNDKGSVHRVAENSKRYYIGTGQAKADFKGGRVMKGRVLAVCISAYKGEKKTNMGKGIMVEDHGLSGDAHSGSWHRQISLLSLDSVNKMRQLGADVGFGDFAENLTIEGIELLALPIGTVLRLGNEVEIAVTQIGKQCHHGCAIRQQVGDCVMPREGIFARVIKGGLVQVGDKIEVDQFQDVNRQRPKVSNGQYISFRSK